MDNRSSNKVYVLIASSGFANIPDGVTFWRTVNSWPELDGPYEYHEIEVPSGLRAVPMVPVTDCDRLDLINKNGEVAFAEVDKRWSRVKIITWDGPARYIRLGQGRWTR